MEKLYGAIEAGGTKFVCMVGTGPERILTEIRIPTTSPQETLAQAFQFFQPFTAQSELAAVGIGSFGPLDLNPRSSTYGYITNTPKPGWSGFDLCGEISRKLAVPVALDTDVNAAAFGEQFWVEANQDLDSLVYMTVGTGIGVGVVVNHQPLHGLIHPEAGHGFVPHDRSMDPFTGVCPYHGDCLEGLASGPAIQKRWKLPAEHLPDNHPGWALEAQYLALGVCNLILHFSPQRIVLGGGVLQHPGLLEQIRHQTLRSLGGYVQSEQILQHINQYIVASALGHRTGVLGALALARSIKLRDEVVDRPAIPGLRKG